jgi:hypothetical protein
MAEVIEIHVAALRRLAAQADRQANSNLGLPTGDAANDASLGHPVDLDEESLHAFRGFATGVAVGTVLWGVVGALVWLGLP